MSSSEHGFVVVMTGPPAVGKDTIADKLVSAEGLNLKKIVTFATRSPRPGEKHGIDHHFISDEELTVLKTQGRIAEYAQTGISFKATPKEPFELVIKKNERLIWRNNPLRAALLSEFYRQNFSGKHAAILIKRSLNLYITVKDPAILLKRWQARAGGQTLSEFYKRYREDTSIYKKYKDRFDFVIENDGEIEKTVEKTALIIKSHFKIN